MLIMTKVYFLFIDQDLNTRIKSLILPVQIQRKSEHWVGPLLNIAKHNSLT